MDAEDLLALTARRRIYEAVRQYPGIGARDAQRLASTGWGETVYHLGRLTGAGLVHRERSAHHDHYFLPNVPAADRSLLRLTRSESARGLILALLQYPRSTVPDLERWTGLSAGRLSIHLRRLVESTWVETGRSGRFRTFELTDPGRVAGLLASYRTGFADRWVDRFLDTWADLFRP